MGAAAGVGAPCSWRPEEVAWKLLHPGDRMEPLVDGLKW